MAITLLRKVDHPVAALLLIERVAKRRHSLRMHPTRSGGISESSESAQQSRKGLRLEAGVPPCAVSLSFLVAETRAFCTLEDYQHC